MLLVCLKELYTEFKKQNPKGFAKFCVIRPKWSIIFASKGSHTVCVCSYHQNVKLLCSTISGNLDYKEYMNLCVCDLADPNSMFHLCELCPDITILTNYLINIFEDNYSDDDDKINYKQWVATDLTTLSCIQPTVDEFIRTATEMIHELRHHHFIKDSKASYLQDLIENLENKACIILMDLAENYSFIIQDAFKIFTGNIVRQSCTHLLGII